MADKNNVQEKDELPFPPSVYFNMDGKVLSYDWNADGQTLSGGWRPRQGEQESPENSYDAIMTRVKK